MGKKVCVVHLRAAMIDYDIKIGESVKVTRMVKGGDQFGQISICEYCVQMRNSPHHEYYSGNASEFLVERA